MNAQAGSLDGEDATRLAVEIRGFSIDSRAVRAGEIFFALSPEDYRRHKFTATDFADAHKFIPQALAEGALYVVARRARVENDEALRQYGNRLVLVDDCIAALQDLARGVIKRWGKTVVGITGSAGKTTTKDLTAHVLTHAGFRVVSTQKNFNNELGVPLSILQMETDGARPEDFDVAVLEMGMSMPGEIAQLCRIARPHIAVELLVAPVHLEFFGSIERIAEGKAQLIENLYPEGTAILNADDERVIAMRAKHSGKILSYSVAASNADVTATNINASELERMTFRLHTPAGASDAELPLAGRHNLSNALAAAAVAHEFGIAPDVIAQAFATARPSAMRGEVLHFSLTPDLQNAAANLEETASKGFTVIDDSYNSNPRSLRAMARMLSEATRLRDAGGAMIEIAGSARRIVIAGEMLELGEDSAVLHYEAGRAIAQAGNINIVWGVRGQAQHLVEGARAVRTDFDDVRFFSCVEDVAAALITQVRAGDVVLIKGSRGVKLDCVIKSLREHFTKQRGAVMA